MNLRSQGERRSSSEEATIATTDASLEAQWSTERLDGDKGLVSNQGKCSVTLSYTHPGRGGWCTTA